MHFSCLPLWKIIQFPILTVSNGACVQQRQQQRIAIAAASVCGCAGLPIINTQYIYSTHSHTHTYSLPCYCQHWCTSAYHSYIWKINRQYGIDGKKCYCNYHNYLIIVEVIWEKSLIYYSNFGYYFKLNAAENCNPS